MNHTFRATTRFLAHRVAAGLLVSALAGAWPGAAVLAGEGFEITRPDGRLRVTLDGELVTEYVYQGERKPILYPVIGPGGIPMTRNYPMKEVEGEAKDHPHHRSLWYTHGRVNGVDFWDERSGTGKTVHEAFDKVEAGKDQATIVARNRWVAPDGKVVLTDTRTIRIHAAPDARILDYDITLHASEGPVVFGDTKEGTMGIRTHPALRLRNDERRGVKSANGKAVNSEGVGGREVWGKRAKWVDYWGDIDGKTLGVAIFDHPSNPRHPTWWHAREYGLIAANPFGIHDFEKKPAGTGDMTIPGGESRTFRYRFILHEGDVKQAKIAGRYADYARSGD